MRRAMETMSTKESVQARVGSRGGPEAAPPPVAVTPPPHRPPWAGSGFKSTRAQGVVLFPVGAESKIGNASLSFPVPFVYIRKCSTAPPADGEDAPRTPLQLAKEVGRECPPQRWTELGNGVRSIQCVHGEVVVCLVVVVVLSKDTCIRGNRSKAAPCPFIELCRYWGASLDGAIVRSK
eukprot:gene12723-biopygen8605